MELLLLLMLCAALVIIASRPPAQPQPQVMFVQAAPASEPTSQSSGCLAWLIGALILLTLLGVIRL